MMRCSAAQVLVRLVLSLPVFSQEYDRRNKQLP
jgi:hypothetical protein